MMGEAQAATTQQKNTHASRALRSPQPIAVQCRHALVLLALVARPGMPATHDGHSATPCQHVRRVGGRGSSTSSAASTTAARPEAGFQGRCNRRVAFPSSSGAGQGRGSGGTARRSATGMAQHPRSAARPTPVGRGALCGAHNLWTTPSQKSVYNSECSNNEQATL
jgi:hypothetical protein